LNHLRLISQPICAQDLLSHLRFKSASRLRRCCPLSPSPSFYCAFHHSKPRASSLAMRSSVSFFVPSFSTCFSECLTPAQIERGCYLCYPPAYGQYVQVRFGSYKSKIHENSPKRVFFSRATYHMVLLASRRAPHTYTLLTYHGVRNNPPSVQER
jgi:hypothetical protein